VTDTDETARIMAEADAGVVVPDPVEGLRAGIGQVWEADEQTLRRWAANARSAAEANSWAVRAERILQLLPSERGASR
jgi:glycosyltransferase involved in cell wall biosynthesis